MPAVARRHVTHYDDSCMSPERDPLLLRAAAAIAGARDARKETRTVVDTARLQRLQRELDAKMFQISCLVFRRAR